MSRLTNGKLDINKIHHGDMFNLLPLLDYKSVDLVFMDLPFGSTRASWDSPVDLDNLWIQLNRIAKDNAPILLFAQPPFDKILATSNLKMYRYEWIWEKTHSTGFLNANKMPLKNFEQILVFYKKLPKYYPQKTSGHKLKSVKIESRKTVKSTIYNKHDNHIGYHSTERFPTSIVRFPSDRQKISLHETQKPVSLLKYFLSTYTDEGDLVLDACSGSGSLAEACLITNRRFICIEKDENFYKKSVERISKLELH